MSALVLATPAVATRPRDVSIDYLRTALTLLVLAHHSSLAYTTWASFDRAHPLQSTSPVVDAARWVGFDYAENFNDVFFMSLMFFISGLFVYPVLRRQGSWGFVRDRLLRLGVPFVFAVVVLMPLAYYASWQEAGRSEGFWVFYQQLASQGFMVGPPWFIWVLLLFDVLVAGLRRPLQRALPLLGRGLAKLRTHAFGAALLLFGLAVAAYCPLLARYGFSTWTVLFTAPFAFQISRIGLYALWFGFGLLVGAPGLAGGLLDVGGSLARRWPLWVGGSALAYNALWFGPRLAAGQHLAPATQQLLEALLWVASCVASCLGCLAFFRGIQLTARPWLNSLARSAYVLYLVHYVYLTWAQLLVLHAPWPALLKFGFVFLATTALSWLTAQALLRIPLLSRIL